MDLVQQIVKRRIVGRVKINIETNRRVDRFLEVLVGTELYGHTKEDVAEELLRKSMEEFIVSGKLGKLKRHKLQA